MSTIRTHFTVTLAVILLLAVAVTIEPSVHASSTRTVEATSVSVPRDTVAESIDFATRVLGDPWNMSEFTDVSQYLNESGQRHILTDIQVEDGIFSATSVGDASSGNAYFFTLFPGYETAIHVGKVGSRFPIDSTTYQCLYIAMKVNSGPANQFGPDQFRVFWFHDDRLNTGGAPYGFTNGIALYPEAGADQPTHIWKLYKVDLRSPSSGTNGTDWTAQSQWQGLRIDPTINADIPFAVDWVRLTACDANTQPITWTPDDSINSLWVRPVGTTRYIRVATDVDGYAGSYSLDIQGLAPGEYYIGLGTTTSCCIDESKTPLTINQSPIADFARPSFTSGAEYATKAGTPWDFDDTGDVTQILNTSSSFDNSTLNLVTESGPLPAGVDAQVHLNTPVPADTQAYRYLTFRMQTEWIVPWQNVPDGMIVRWIWSVQGSDNVPAHRCHLVSHDIPFDTGWQTYTVDLADEFAGQAEENNGKCDGIANHWNALDRPVLETRFDPNENITVAADNVSGGGPFYQKLDWIKLTKVDSVVKGSTFPIQVVFNKPEDELFLQFYYTTNPNTDPTQHRAEEVASETTPPDDPGPYDVFLPLVTNSFSSTFEGVVFDWDTSSVATGQYYICVVANDGYNSITFCSEAPVQVL